MICGWNGNVWKFFWLGLALALAAGAMAGGCMLPLRLLRRWKWENMWLMFSIVALVVVPWGLALLLIPEPTLFIPVFLLCSSWHQLSSAELGVWRKF